MTDEHGPDSEPMHEDASHEEHAPQPAETWSDDHPPVDDFSDAGGAGEEAATASEEASEEEASSTTSAPPARSMLPLFAGIGGILLIGAVIYWQFGHSSPTPPMMVTQTPKSASSLPPGSRQAPIPSDAKVGESDITALYKTPAEPAPPPLPSPSSGTSPTTSLIMPPEAATPSAPPAPAMPAVAPSVGQVNSPASLMPSTPAIASVPPSSAASADVRIDTLAASVNTLEKSVQATTQEMNKLNTMVVATQAMPPSSQPNPALEDRLNKIEQDLMQIEHNEAAKPAASTPAPAIAMPAETEATSEVVTRPVSHHKKPVKHKPVHKKIVHHATSLVVSAPVTSPLVASQSARIESSWVLRAATPGEAWVASDAHTAELKHVQVGDSLSGIGTIRAIRQTPGGWEIEGSAGTIQ